MTTLENLYYENIIPFEVSIEKGREYDSVNKLVVRHDEALTATLTEQQKEMFTKLKEAKMDLLNLGERDAFIRGFSLAVRRMGAALTDEKSCRRLCRPVSQE